MQFLNDEKIVVKLHLATRCSRIYFSGFFKSLFFIIKSNKGSYKFRSMNDKKILSGLKYLKTNFFW